MPANDTAPALERLYLEIYRREFRYVWHQLRRLGIATADLPDVTHDVFMIVHRHLPQFDTSRPVRPWLFGILFRTAADTLRLRRRTREVQPATWLDPEDPRPRPDEALLDRQTRTIAGGILASLDPRLQQVLIMHDLGEIDVTQIAAQLGIPVKTVYTRLRLGRARFAAAAEGRGRTGRPGPRRAGAPERTAS